MSVDAIQRDLSGLFNYPSDPNPTTQADYQNAVKNWVNGIINLVDLGLWQPTTDYAVGNIIRTPSIAPQYVLMCTTAGTSGDTEPTYTDVHEGSVISDGSGTLVWTVKIISTSDTTYTAGVGLTLNGTEFENAGVRSITTGLVDGTIAVNSDGIVDDVAVKGLKSAAFTESTDYATVGDLAEVNADIADTNADVSVNAKDIANIKKLLEGQLYDYETDTDSAYTKSVPAGAMPYAALEKLGGKTVVWNQLNNQPSYTITNTDYTITWDGTTGLYTINVINALSASADNTTSNIPAVIGHKYLLPSYTGASGTSFRIYCYDISSNTYNSAIFTALSDTLRIRVRSTTDIDVGTHTAYLPLYDLTLMFGAGNEPTTVAEFEQMFGASYYAYNRGTLLSAGVTSVVSVGKNLINVADQTITSQTTLTTVALEPGDYVLSFIATNNSTITGNVRVYKGSTMINTVSIANGDVNANKLISLTLTESGTYSINASGQSSGYSFTIKNVMLEHSDTKTDYTPYKAPITYSIPAAVQALTGYGWSAGSASNYIDFERKVFVQNVGRVVLDGTQNLRQTNWRAGDGCVGWTYYYNLLNNAVPAGGVVGNLVSSKFVAVEYGYMWNIYKQGIALYQNTDNSICILQSDTTLTNATAINNYLSANPITVYYELATPVETDISAYLTDDNLIEVEPNGTLTFPNQNGTDYQIPVPSTEEYMIDLQNA